MYSYEVHTNCLISYLGAIIDIIDSKYHSIMWATYAMGYGEDNVYLVRAKLGFCVSYCLGFKIWSKADTGYSCDMDS